MDNKDSFIDSRRFERAEHGGPGPEGKSEIRQPAAPGQIDTSLNTAGIAERRPPIRRNSGPFQNLPGRRPALRRPCHAAPGLAIVRAQRHPLARRKVGHLNPKFPLISGEDGLSHFPMHVREPEIAALETNGEFLVVDAQ